jgi:hypothetical protein
MGGVPIKLSSVTRGSVLSRRLDCGCDRPSYQFARSQRKQTDSDARNEPHYRAGNGHHQPGCIGQRHGFRHRRFLRVTGNMNTTAVGKSFRVL